MKEIVSDSDRAQELRRLLETQIRTTGYSSENLESFDAMVDYLLDTGKRVSKSEAIGDALDTFLEIFVLSPRLRLQIGLVFGELYGAGDLASMQEEADRESAKRQAFEIIRSSE